MKLRFKHVLLTLLVTVSLSYPSLVVLAQEIGTPTTDGEGVEETASVTASVEPTSTEVPPDTATPEPTATEGTPAASATASAEPTETPGYDATATETPELTLTPSETPELTLTPSLTPTLTETPTLTPELADSWRIEYDLFYPDSFIYAAGGSANLESNLRGFLDGTLAGEPASYQLELQNQSGGSLYLLTIQGEGDFSQFQRLYLGPLKQRFGTAGSVTQIWITDKGAGDTNWRLSLDALFSTGYSWHIEDISGIEQSSGAMREVLGGIGSEGRQNFYFFSTPQTNAPRTISLKYRAAWEPGAAPVRRIYLDFSIQGDLNLSSPELAMASFMSEAPPMETNTGELELVMGTVPASFDWRSSGKVTPVRSQGACGSCWAFGTVGVMESAMLINGTSVDLSEQFLVSCTLNYNNGCKGGYMDSHKYHKATLGQQQSVAGAVLESAMPYVQGSTAEEAPCYPVAHPYRLESWYRIGSTWGSVPGIEDIKRTIFTKGPVMVGICTGPAFDEYSGGIFTTSETCGDQSINHVVILTGWKTDPVHGTVWIMKNSWGTWWGDNGYMYIKAGTSKIGYSASYVVYAPLGDRISPMVSKTDSNAHSADNKITTGEQLTVNVKELLVTYDEAMYFNNGVNDVTTLSNYALVNLGANGILGGGDDIAVPINSASYAADTKKVTLKINNGDPLPNADYRFTISGSGTVMDKSGLRLDGDGDGYAGGDYAISFRVSVKPSTPVVINPVTAWMTNDTTPTFNWYSALHAASYEIVIARDSGFTNIVFTRQTGSATTYTFTVLPEGKYYWRVRGINRYGTFGSWTAARNFIIDTTPPPAPALLTPADLSSTRGTSKFTWKASLGAKYYQMRTTTTTGSTIYLSPQFTVLYHTPPAQPLGVILWQVRAGDAAGNWSAWSTPRSLLIKPQIPAAVPLVSPVSSLNTQLRTPMLDWDTVPYGNRYEFQVSKSSQFATIIQGGTTPSSEFTLISLEDRKYYWRVRGINVDGEIGKWSIVRNFIIDNIAPKSPTLALPGDNKINKGTPTYSWNSVSGGFAYQFRYTNLSNVVLYTSTELKTLNHKPPLQPIGTYRWQVRARDAAGNWSPYSNYRTIEILAPFPAPPKLTLPAHKSTTSDTTPTLSWEQAGYAVGYEIQISLNYSFTKIVVQPTVNGQLSYTPNPLPVTGSGTTFYWRVRSINVYGQKGNWSSYRYFKVTQ